MMSSILCLATVRALLNEKKQDLKCVYTYIIKIPINPKIYVVKQYAGGKIWISNVILISG